MKYEELKPGMTLKVIKNFGCLPEGREVTVELKDDGYNVKCYMGHHPLLHCLNSYGELEGFEVCLNNGVNLKGI